MVHSQKIFPLDLFERFFSPLSAHMVEYKEMLYATAEHAYHCQRYTDPTIRKEIETARSPQKAWEASQKHKSQQLPDFNDRKVAVMEDIFRAKLAQHEDVKEALKNSGDEVIVKNYPDPFWGIGKDGDGKNEMGKIWMKLREELKR